MSNRQLILKSRPKGLIEPNTFAVESSPIPQLGADDVLVQVLTISIDPAMRVWIVRKTYIE
jgi:NADPH-dependent curcumin reductase CurA